MSTNGNTQASSGEPKVIKQVREISPLYVFVCVRERMLCVNKVSIPHLPRGIIKISIKHTHTLPLFMVLLGMRYSRANQSVSL